MARKQNQKSKAEELREFYEIDLWEFAQYINPHYYYGEIHKDVFRWLQHGGNNQLLLMPRGHLKSHCIAVWTVWQITRDPCTTLVYLSAGEDLANAQIYAIKNMMESDRYRLLWPEMLHPEEGKRDKWTAWAFNVDHPLRKQRGIRDHTVIVKTVKSNATGLHCSHLVFDDVVVPSNAYSESGRKDVEQAVSQFASILSTGGVTKAVGTRYHPKDVYQSFIDAEIPEYEDPQTGELVAPQKLWEIKEYRLETAGDGTGEYLWPRGQQPDTNQWFGFDARERAYILAKYRSMNETTQFYAQYYNDPNDPSSHRVSRDKFQYYDKKFLAQKDGYWYFKDKRLSIYCSMDVAWTVGKRSDYTAIAVIGVDPEGFIYILELDQFKTDKYDRYYEAVIGLHHKWGFRKIRVETNSGGKFIAEELQRLIRQNGDSLAVEGKAKTSHDQAKAERHAVILETRYESQTIWHYKGGYIDAYEEQLILERPPHDDLLDAVTGAIEISKPPGKMMGSSGSSNVKYIVPNSRFGGVRRVR